MLSVIIKFHGGENFPGGSAVKNPPAIQEIPIRSLGWGEGPRGWGADGGRFGCILGPFPSKPASCKLSHPTAPDDLLDIQS